MHIALLDKYGNIVGNSNGEIATIKIDSTFNSKSEYTPFVEGEFEFLSSAGVFNITGVEFTATPGDNYSKLRLKSLGLYIESPSIDMNKPSN